MRVPPAKMGLDAGGQEKYEYDVFSCSWVQVSVSALGEREIVSAPNCIR